MKFKYYNEITYSIYIRYEKSIQHFLTQDKVFIYTITLTCHSNVANGLSPFWIAPYKWKLSTGRSFYQNFQ